MVDVVDDSLRVFSQQLFYFTLNLKPGTHAEEKPLAGLMQGQILFGCTNETSMHLYLLHFAFSIRF
jgi:hypothetical protein